jgi:hypothetical protein
MASELPPTYYFTDISFNPSFYSSGSDNITNDEAKKNYLSYPTAQGTETISTLNSSTITSNSYNLSGIPPTLTTTSLGYFVNYTKTSSSFAVSNRFLYSPASNTATTDSNYLEAGVYMANIHMYAVAAAGQTYSNTFQIGIASGTSIQTLVNNSQYGTMILTSGDLVSINAGANTTGNNYVFSHSGCFTLTSSSFVHLEFWLRGQSGATQTYNLSGCIYRIA